MEASAELETIELNRLRAVAADNARARTIQEDSLRYLESEVRKGTSVMTALDEEKEMLHRLLVDVREESKRELQKLELEVNRVRERNSHFSQTFSDREMQYKRSNRERCQLEESLGKERNELKLLEQLKQGNAVEDDAILRDKRGVSKQISSMDSNNENVLSVIASVESELVAVSEQSRSMRQLLKEAEGKIAILTDQNSKLLKDKKAQVEESDKLRNEITALDVRRTDIIASIERADISVDGQLRKELKEETRSSTVLSKKLDEVDNQLAHGSASIAELDKRFLDAQHKYKAISTQSEFMQHQADSIVHALAQQRHEIKALANNLSQLVNANKASDLESKCARNDELCAEIEKLKTELHFLSENGMIGPDGLIKPLLLDHDGSGSYSLVERLGINEFLMHAQSHAEIGQVCVILIEKMSELLEMIHNAEESENRYTRDVERTSEMLKQLAEKNAELNTQVASLNDFRTSALVQIGLNQAGRSKLILTGLGFTDADLSELFDKLSPEEKGKIDSLHLAENALVDFNMVRLVTECLSLKHVDVTGNSLETLNELERFLRNKVDGITSVFRDTRLLICNSGLQVRLTVRYA